MAGAPAPTFKMGYGFHPLGAWLANTAESLAMLLRPGNAGSNTFTDHLAVLTAAIRQIPSLPVPAAGPRRRGRCQPRADQPPAVAVVLARPRARREPPPSADEPRIRHHG